MVQHSASLASPKVARKWMHEEDQRLRAILANYESGTDINWHQVASHIPGRNNKECRKRWIYALMPSLRKGPWNEQEDALLLEGVRQHGLKWPLVSQTVGSRQPDQCSRRWHESLNPNINHGRWSLFEDQVLREAVQTYGRRWTEIVERYFPNRTPIAAKKRHNQCFPAKVKAPTSDSGYDSSNDNHGNSPSPMRFKQEEQENGQLLWHVPDHSQNFSPRTSYPAEAPHFLTDPSRSTPVVPTMSQYSGTIDMTHQSYTAPNSPHYSPTYSRADSIGHTQVAAEYPTTTVQESQPMWMPTETQSAYSGSPFVFHDTGYFEPSYSYRTEVMGTLR